jgi:hypothetical protein
MMKNAPRLCVETDEAPLAGGACGASPTTRFNLLVLRVTPVANGNTRRATQPAGYAQCCGSISPVP